MDAIKGVGIVAIAIIVWIISMIAISKITEKILKHFCYSEEVIGSVSNIVLVSFFITPFISNNIQLFKNALVNAFVFFVVDIYILVKVVEAITEK